MKKKDTRKEIRKKKFLKIIVIAAVILFFAAILGYLIYLGEKAGGCYRPQPDKQSTNYIEVVL